MKVWRFVLLAVLMIADLAPLILQSEEEPHVALFAPILAALAVLRPLQLLILLLSFRR